MINGRVNSSQLKTGIVLSYIAMGIGYLIAIVYTPIMLRLLGQSEYGLYNLVASVVSYLGLLSFGFGSAYMRYYTRYKTVNDTRSISKLNGMFLIIFSIIGLVAILAGVVLVMNVESVFGDKLTTSELSTSRILLALMIFNIALSFPASVFNTHITANEKFVFQKLLQIIKTVVNPFLVLPILLLGYKSIGLVVMTTLLSLITEIINVIFCVKKLHIKFDFSNFDIPLMKEMAVFSSFIFVNMVVDQINWNVGKFLLGRYWGTISVAIYGLAMQLNTYYLSLGSAISQVFIPRVNSMVSESCSNAELTKLFTKVGRIQFMLLSLILTGFIFFGRPFIQFWAGADYHESYFIALLLFIPVTIPLIQNIGIEIQKAKNMHKFRSIVYFFIAVVNVIISIPLTKYYGGIGAAFGTAISLIAGNAFLMNWYYQKKMELNMSYFWIQILQILPSTIPPILFGLIAYQYFNLEHFWTLIFCGLSYTFIFLLSLWFFGMNKFERDLFIKPIKNLLNRQR